MIKHLVRFLKGVLVTIVFSIPLIIIVALCEAFGAIENLIMCFIGLIVLSILYFLGLLVEEEF